MTGNVGAGNPWSAMTLPFVPTNCTYASTLTASWDLEGFTSTTPHETTVNWCPRCCSLQPVWRTRTTVGRRVIVHVPDCPRSPDCLRVPEIVVPSGEIVPLSIAGASPLLETRIEIDLPFT